MTINDEKSQTRQYKFKANLKRRNSSKSNTFRFDTIKALTNRIYELEKERKKNDERKNKEYSILTSADQRKKSNIKTKSTKKTKIK